MSNPAQQEGLPMDEVALKKRIHELVEILSVVPLAQKIAGGSYHPEPPKPTSDEDTFAFLQLHLKYLMFDVEATRRENRYLRQLLENRQPPRANDDISPF